MTINISLNSDTVSNFRTAFIQLRPKCTEAGNTLRIKHKDKTFILPRTVTGVNRKGFIK